MSTKKSPRNQDSSSDVLTFEDVSLTRKYSVIEIAMLAAGCRGETREERISDAVELLALVERYAIAGKETRCRIRERRKAKENGNVECQQVGYSHIQKQFQKAVDARDAATRDKKTGRIELTSLVGLTYEAATGGKADSSEAMRRFNEWVKEEADGESRV
jgi:hypothetical protein